MVGWGVGRKGRVGSGCIDGGSIRMTQKYKWDIYEHAC